MESFLLHILLPFLVFYILLVFVLARLVFPFYGFRKTPPSPLPTEIKAKVEELENQSTGALDFAQKLFVFSRSRWGAARLSTVTHLPMAFRTNLLDIWNQPGYAHCQTINHLFYSMLCGSRWFRPEDVKVKYKFFNGVAHQYLKVGIDGQWLTVDPSVTYLPLKLGDQTHLFG